MNRTHASVLALAAVFLLAGCVAPQAPDTGTLEGGDDIGEVDGISHDEEIRVTVDDGLNESERDLLVRRSMARIEVVRGLNFERSVEVEVMTREEYLEDRGDGEPDETYARWNNQVWEGLFIVGEDRDVTEVFDETFGAAVQGVYLPGEERIVLVSDSETPTVGKQTLVHELVHALQDQQFGLDEQPPTQDEQLARNSVVEGEAELVPRLYLDRCGEEWSCIRPSGSAGTGGDIDRGLLLVIIQPYAAGPDFVETVREREGWAGIDRLHAEYPGSTTEIIHPEKHPEFEPADVTVSDRSTGEWSRFDREPVGDTLGEASIYSMFLANGVIEAEQPGRYRHPVSQGWAGDTLVPYRNDGEFGYVWETTWETPEDARLFRETYLDLLESRGGRERGARSYVVPEGPYADAFRVTLEGDTVRIVNGPDVESLGEIHDGKQ